MPSMVHINSAWVVFLGIAIVFVLLYPIVIALIARQRLKVSWRYFWFGVLIFALFQILTRIPATYILQQFVFAQQLRDSATFRFIWLVILAVTAGLFEECGRYVAYRWFMKNDEKTWSKGVMYGIGHGGLECIMVGALQITTLINVIVLSSINLNTLPIATHAQVVQQFAQLNAQPGWFPLLGAWERLWTLPVQIALSIVVLQVFRRNNIGWLGLAILAHAVVDFVSVELLQLLGGGTSAALIDEGVIALFGLIALWIIWRLRERPAQMEVYTQNA